MLEIRTISFIRFLAKIQINRGLLYVINFHHKAVCFL